MSGSSALSVISDSGLLPSTGGTFMLLLESAG